MRALLTMITIAALGCGGGKAKPPANGGTDASSEEEARADHHRHHHQGGFAMLIELSLDSLHPTEKQIVELGKIRSDLNDKMIPAKSAERAVLVALADGIRAGAIDRAALDARMSALKAAAENLYDNVADALDALHRLHTPEQRAALVDKISTHFEAWHRANAHPKHDDRGGHLARLQRELKLSDKQVDTIRASFIAAMQDAPKFDREQADAHIKEFGTAFASDHFEAHSIHAPLAPLMAVWGITRTVRFYESVEPALTPEQREKLAQDLHRRGK